MTLLEAYNMTWTAVNRLRESGIATDLRPAHGASQPETVAKYGNREDRLPPEQWMHVTFQPKDSDQASMIHIEAKGLRCCGVCFDTGGMCGQRDWELDWSFHVGEPSLERETAASEVEDMIQNQLKED